MKTTIKTLLLALAFIPLVKDTSVFFPDSAGKIFFFRLDLVMAGMIFLGGYIFIKQFKEKVGIKTENFIRHPIFISVLVYISVFVLSAIFAIDKFSAFWGDVQRGEGLVGTLFIFSFFGLGLLIFERKDWILFFKLSLITSGILLFKEFLDFFSGIQRPGSYIGNPTFLAGYYLFSIFSALMVFQEARPKFWKFFSVGIGILSITGIFITETRGAILGLFLGLVSVLIYLILKGKDKFYRNVSYRKISALLLSLLVLFSAVFFLSRNAAVWQKVPGLARAATIGSADISTQTRIWGTKTSLESVQPTENGWKKLILGWGPNNYVLAFGKYFHAEQFKYEREWFDRAHNKILDVLVMMGILGLLAYLSIWYFYFRSISVGNFSIQNFALVFYGTSSFTHLLFVFDHISTLIPFYAVLAYLISEFSVEKKGNSQKIYIGLFIALTILLGASFFTKDLSAYYDMKKYINFKYNGDTFEPQMNSMFKPFTIAQTPIRRDFLERLPGETALVKGEEHVEKSPKDFRFQFDLGGAYTNYGENVKNLQLIRKGEGHIREALNYAPERPDFLNGLALNLAHQKRFAEAYRVLEPFKDMGIAETYYQYGLILGLEGEKNYKESLNYFEKSFYQKPYLYLENKENMEASYSSFVKYFYETRNKEAFLQSAERLMKNKYAQSASLQQIIRYVEKGEWPQIRFK